MLKRAIDVLVAAFGLLIMSPVLIVFGFAIWLQDFHSPLYVANRVGLHKKTFKMIKLRSMVFNADASGITSTSNSDRRITRIGMLIRKLKLDEVTQLVNVLLGDMSLVGPRPNVLKWGVELYTEEEMHLLSVRPGITDFSSIVFSDEGAILSAVENPDLAYNQLIRPWKSRLSLAYIDHMSLKLDLKLVLITVLSIVFRQHALKLVVQELRRLGESEELIQVASRTSPLKPFPPPGSARIAVLHN